MEKLSSASLAWLRRTRPGLLILALVSCSCFCCFGQLPTDLDLPSETLNDGSLVFQASNSITNIASFLVQDPASVTLTAGSYIKLEPGVDAVATNGAATFQAVINPNVVNWKPIPVPAPPTACTDCGLNYDESASGISPQATYAPSSTNILYAVCLDEYGDVVACNLSLSVAAYESTNGHYHNFPLAPTSGISPSSGYTGSYPNWNMPVTLATTQVGQFETVSVVPTGCGEGDTCIETNYDYAVGYTGLVYIGNSNIFMQTGGNTTNHGDNTFNHYMTVTAATGLQNAATFYINQYNPGQKVCINDMALPMGGKFDINDDWQSPHKSHDPGTAADVSDASGQCPASYVVNANRFEQACINAGTENTLIEFRHVHCRWAY
ncbi:MAG: hypothetical protein ABR920_09755 [Terriglobales bacterium]